MITYQNIIINFSRSIHIFCIVYPGKLYLTLIFFLVLFFGCEDIDVLENQTTFEEKIIVVAELKANTAFEGVQFTKSLPFSEDYNIRKAELKNVFAYLRHNDLKVIPLHYNHDGIYNSIYKLMPSPGDVFELFAVYNNKSIYSKTIIPKQPRIESADLTGADFIEAYIYPEPNEVYGALWLIPSDSIGIKSPAFYKIYANTINTPGTTLYLRTVEIPVQFRSSSNLYIQVTAFDKNFLDYYQTRNNNQPVSDIFSQVGAPVKWNVYGEDAIGLFIGLASSMVIAR